MDTVREGASGNDSSFQFTAVVNYLSREQREQLLQQAQLPLAIPADHALALKANLSIPWTKFRVLRRYSNMKSYLCIKILKYHSGGSSL